MAHTLHHHIIKQAVVFMKYDPPRKQVDQVWLRHPIRQDTRNGCNTGPEQVNLGLPFTPKKVKIYNSFVELF